MDVALLTADATCTKFDKIPQETCRRLSVSSETVTLAVRGV